MRVLGVIPARGGSKGIPRKNLFQLYGRPLIGYTIAAAQESRLLSRFVVSTEDSEILSVARQCGAEAPFVRPLSLAEDTSRSVDVIQHALMTVEELESNKYDMVVMLQPTAPLRRASDIDAAIELLKGSNADAVVTVTKVEEPHPIKMLRIENNYLQPFVPDRWHEANRRQELESVYAPNGAVYCVRRDVLLEKRTLWGAKTLPYVMPLERSINIDHPLDLIMAEAVLVRAHQ